MTYVRLWQYVAELFLKWKFFSGRSFIDKTFCVQLLLLFFFFFFRKLRRLWDNVKKYGRAGQAADDSIIRRIRFACLITKAT
jgi:hypothetical protein